MQGHASVSSRIYVQHVTFFSLVTVFVQQVSGQILLPFNEDFISFTREFKVRTRSTRDRSITGSLQLHAEFKRNPQSNLTADVFFFVIGSWNRLSSWCTAPRLVFVWFWFPTFLQTFFVTTSQIMAMDFNVISTTATTRHTVDAYSWYAHSYDRRRAFIQARICLACRQLQQLTFRRRLSLCFL